jgi:uncharacterized damage-inducible protein DinB
MLMSQKTHFQNLFAYHNHTTRRLLESAAHLDTKVYHREGEYGHGSIHDLLFHLLRADQGWRIGLETLKQQTGLSAEDYASLEALSQAFEEEQLAWETYLETLSEADIESELTLIDRRGNPRTFAHWRVLQHLILHGMQHHSEIAQLLTLQGQPPGNLDFIFYA